MRHTICGGKNNPKVALSGTGDVQNDFKVIDGWHREREGEGTGKKRERGKGRERNKK